MYKEFTTSGLYKGIWGIYYIGILQGCRGNILHLDYMVTWDLGVKVWGLGSQKVGFLGAPGKYRTHKEILGGPSSDSVGPHITGNKLTLNPKPQESLTTPQAAAL